MATTKGYISQSNLHTPIVILITIKIKAVEYSFIKSCALTKFESTNKNITICLFHIYKDSKNKIFKIS